MLSVSICVNISGCVVSMHKWFYMEPQGHVQGLVFVLSVSICVNISGCVVSMH